jgi:dTDP-4-dehydrorhamnose reductase
MNIVVLGSGSQIGSDLQFILSEKQNSLDKTLKRAKGRPLKEDSANLKSFLDSYKFSFLTKHDCDITLVNNVEDAIDKYTPDIIINLASYNDVDKAEEEGVKTSLSVNAEAIKSLSTLCSSKNIKLIHFSTNYVFDGKNRLGYEVGSDRNPLNKYGEHKLKGEDYIKAHLDNSVLIRTSFVYGGGISHNNFVNSILQKSNENRGGGFSMVSDQVITSVYSKDIGFSLISIIENLDKYLGQTIHLVNEGSVNLMDFTEKIIELLCIANIELTPIKTAQTDSKVIRPLNNTLINDSDLQLRPWEEALADYLYTLR